MAPRFRPALLPSFFVALGLLILVALGSWQASRYTEKLAIEARVAERSALPAVRIQSAAELDRELAYRPVIARGRWDRARSQLFKHRQFQGAPGFWLVTPLILADQSVLLVNRGWLPFQRAEAFAREERARPRNALHEVEGIFWIPKEVFVDEATRARIGRDGALDADSPIYAWDTLDIDGVYASLGDIERPAPPALLVAAARDDGELPIASTDHITRPYMTSDRHLGYAAFWYTTGAALLALWIAASFGFVGSTRRATAAPNRSL